MIKFFSFCILNEVCVYEMNVKTIFALHYIVDMIAKRGTATGRAKDMKRDGVSLIMYRTTATKMLNLQHKT